MIELNKKEGESSTSLLRRFTRKMRESGILQRARGLRFKIRPNSDLIKKRKAIKRVKRKAKMEYLRKLGKID